MVVEGAYELTDAGASPDWPERTLHLSHEMTEVLTDPYDDGWKDGNNEEISDLCNKNAVTRYPPQLPVTAEILGMPVWQAWSNSACRCVTKRDVALGDVAGEGVPDPIIYDPNASPPTWTDWANVYSPTTWPPGLAPSSQLPFLLDTTGNGITSLQLYDPSAYVIRTWDYGYTPSPTIGETDSVNGPWNIPVPGDYDGDGIGDLAVWNKVTGNWFIQYSSKGKTVLRIQWAKSALGLSAQAPANGYQGAQGDYDGDGLTDMAFFSPATGWTILETYYWNLSGGGLWQSDKTKDISGKLMPGDVVVPADFDGDGRTDLAFYRQADPTNPLYAGTFYVQNSSNDRQYSVPLEPLYTPYLKPGSTSVYVTPSYVVVPLSRIGMEIGRAISRSIGMTPRGLRQKEVWPLLPVAVARPPMLVSATPLCQPTGRCLASSCRSPSRRSLHQPRWRLRGRLPPS
jgi:hypothetical protein